MQREQNRLSLRTTTEDPRRFNRLDVRVDAQVSHVPASSPDDALWEVLRPRGQHVVVSDLSATGLYFVSAIDFDLGQELWIALDIQATVYPIRAVIVRQQAHIREGRRIYGYGVQFLRSRFAPTAVAAILEFLAQRISVLKEQRSGGKPIIRRILAKI